MDTPEKSRRLWWRRKRWALAFALWLLVLPFLYFLSGGPALYAIQRGWLSEDTATAFYVPCQPVFRRWPALADLILPYTWWYELGRRHAASD